MIDHLVYITRNLEQTAQRISAALNVEVKAGGRHLNRGTRNSVLRIGPHTYLELLAADPTNTDFAGERWMGVDLLPADEPGRLSRWSLAVRDGQVPLDANDKPFDAGEFEGGSRQLADGTELKWQLTAPGTRPLIRPLPFLIDWYGQAGPAAGMPDQGCQLVKLKVAAAEVDDLRPLAKTDTRLEFAYYPTPMLTATIVNAAGDKLVLV